MPELRVMLVDDHTVLRAGLQLLINEQPDMMVVAEAGTAEEALRLVGQHAVDVILMDLSLPDGDGVEVTEQILRQHPQARIVGLTRHEDGGYLRRMRAAGARGYVLKQSVAEGLLTAIRAVARGEAYIDPSFAAAEPPRQPTYGAPPTAAVSASADAHGALTADEVAVLQRIAWSYSNHEIAQQLGLRVTAVAAHKAQAMQKLGLSTRIDVVRYAEAQGWKRTEPS